MSRSTHSDTPFGICRYHRLTCLTKPYQPAAKPPDHQCFWICQQSLFHTDAQWSHWRRCREQWLVWQPWCWRENFLQPEANSIILEALYQKDVTAQQQGLEQVEIIWVPWLLEKVHLGIVLEHSHMKQLWDGLLHWEMAAADWFTAIEYWLPLEYCNYTK